MVELELIASPEKIITQLNTLTRYPLTELDFQEERFPSITNIRTWLFHPANQTKRALFVASDLKSADSKYGKVYVEKGFKGVKRNSPQTEGIYELLIIQTKSPILLNQGQIPKSYLLLLYAEENTNKESPKPAREDYVNKRPTLMTNIIPTSWLLK